MDSAYILVAIPETKSRTQVIDVLKQGGFERILEADSGAEAIHFLRSHRVDGLVTDVPLQQLDGWRLTRLVRSGIFSTKADIPIIVTSHAHSEHIAQVTAKDHEVNRFIPLHNYQQIPAALKVCLEAEKMAPRKASLLVVEDYPDTAELARRVLRGRFEVETADDGEAGLNAWKKNRHSLVLLDIMLPKLSGGDVLKEILKIQPNQPVVMMTAYGTAERAGELVMAGAVDFIAKPFRAEHLRRVCDIASRRQDYMVSNQEFNHAILEKDAAQKTAEQASYAKSVFLANMSHEFNTPLNAIIGFSQVLESNPPSEKKQLHAMVEKIHTAGNHLLGMVRNLLTLCNIDTGSLSLNPHDFPLDSFLSDLVQSFQGRLKERGNQLEHAWPAELGSIFCDSVILHQMLLQLLDNANKFTEQGIIYLSAEDCPEEQIEGIKITVRDNGIGIQEQDIAHIFDTFAQADPSSTRAYGGAGLGLSVCRRLCDVLEGKVWVTSELDKGATFQVWLPRTPPK